MILEDSVERLIFHPLNRGGVAAEGGPFPLIGIY